MARKTPDAEAAAIAAAAVSLEGTAPAGVGDRLRGALAGARNPAGTPVPAGPLSFKSGIFGVGDGTVDPAKFRATLEDDIDKLFRSSRSAAKGGRTAKAQVLKDIRDFAAKLTGKTAEEVPKLGLKNVRQGLIAAIKNGATKTQIGGAAGLLLQEHLDPKLFQPKGATAEGVISKTQRSLRAGGAGRARLTGAVAASGAVHPAKRFLLTNSLKRTAGLFGAYFLAEHVLGRVEKGRENDAKMRRILSEGAGADPPLVSPDLFLDFLGSQGPEFNQAVQSNPQIAIALHDRLQSMAAARIPQGSAILRTSRAEGVSADSLLGQ